MFKVNDYVFYGTKGVSRIEQISELEFGEKGKLYYVIKPVDEHMGTIYALVDGDKTFIRKIISKKKAKELIDNISDVDEIKLDDRKLREAEYREIEKSGDYGKWLGMLKNAYKQRQKKLDEGKKLLASEEQLFKSAEGLLMQEFAVALGMSTEEVRELIISKGE